MNGERQMLPVHTIRIRASSTMAKILSARRRDRGDGGDGHVIDRTFARRCGCWTTRRGATSEAAAIRSIQTPDERRGTGLLLRAAAAKPVASPFGHSSRVFVMRSDFGIYRSTTGPTVGAPFDAWLARASDASNRETYQLCESRSHLDGTMRLEGTLEHDGFGPEAPSGDAPRSPTGRVPQWAMEEAAGRVSQLTEPGSPYPSHPPADARRSRGSGRRGRVRGFTSALVILAIVGAAQTTGIWKPLVGFANDSDSYKFLAHQSDGKTPVAYDRCRPIHFVIRQQGEPPGSDPIVFTAVERVSQATGLHFVFDGTTSEAPSNRRPNQQPRYGTRWAPVLISWSNPKESPRFAKPDVLGVGGSDAVTVPSGARVLVTGAVTLDSEKLGKILKQPDGDQVVRAVVLHELGHVVGLDHVDAKSQIMYKRVQHGMTDFGGGDLTGLAALGKGGCFPSL